jgi:hypothetical protein
MLDKKQRQWVETAAHALQLAVGTDDPSAEHQSEDAGTEHLDAQQQSAKKQYDDSLNLLTPQFKRAIPFDKDGALRGKINAAVGLAKAGSYLDAHNALDDAGQSATALISAQSTEHQQTSDLIGKALPEKYKNEQFQKDASGLVMHGGEFRGGSDRRTNYYDEDRQDLSAMRTDEQGRLISPLGHTVDGNRGYVVSQETGALHGFNPSPHPTKSSDGYDLYDHHSSPIQGGNAAAGEMDVEKGVVRKVTDQSGHYRPTPEMTHQMVERMQDQGVATREQKLTMLDKDGNPRGVTREIKELWNEVADYEGQRQESSDSSPYDPEMLKKKQKLKDLGVGPSNREARVDLTNPKSFVGPEEFEQVKGDNDKIVQMVEEKIGVKLNETHANFGTDFSSVEKINDWIGIVSRMAALQPEKGFVDPKKTRLQMSTEQFAQTGGNVAAIRGMEAVNAQVEQRRQAGDDQEQQRMAAMIESMGGDGKLAQLGVKDPTKLSVDQKFLILSKGRIPEDMQKKIGKPPLPSPQPTPGAVAPTDQPSVSDTRSGEGPPDTEQAPVSYTELRAAPPNTEEPPVSYTQFGGGPQNTDQPPVSYTQFGAGPPNTEEAPVSYTQFGGGPQNTDQPPVSYNQLGAKPPNTEEAPVSYAQLGAEQTKPAPGGPESEKLELSESEEEFEKLEFSESEEESPEVEGEGDTSAPDRKWTMRDLPKAGKELNLKSKQPAPAPHPRQAEYDQLGGDRGLLDKLLPAWKHRNQPVLDKLLDLNKRFETATGAEKDNLSAAIRALAAELDHRDHMPTLHILAGESIDEKLAQLKS